jgi:hypothetical protein
VEEMTYFIDLRAESAGGNVVAGPDDVIVRTDAQPNPSPHALDADLVQAVQGRDVLLATHGFHVNRAAGISNLRSWHDWLQLGPNGFFVGVLWPGDSRWIPFVDYPLEGNEAIQGGRVLAAFLRKKFAGVNSLSFTSHSLGARVMLETIRNLGQAFQLETLTLMAPAVDDTVLVGEYRDSAAAMKKVSVLASSRDEVLKLAFPAGNTFAGIVTRGEPYWHGALGRYGPNPANQPGNLWQAPNIPDDWAYGHHNYINADAPAPGQPQSGRFIPPVVVPPQGTPPPPPAQLNWQEAFSAGFVSTRFPGT